MNNYGKHELKNYNKINGSNDIGIKFHQSEGQLRKLYNQLLGCVEIETDIKRARGITYHLSQHL